ncbi:hypothetical protein AVEN_3751-1 [Araneus ventricosus]|uniref:Uncharacterized protein n=1 Tax=Araneus ventricosus TaxID=182803 RepID=A0A4Y2RKY9_ARAVE|nr:hypothetical protein AVEN_3751-1 [Araneus ventricosus]
MQCPFCLSSLIVWGRVSQGIKYRFKLEAVWTDLGDHLATVRRFRICNPFSPISVLGENAFRNVLDDSCDITAYQGSIRTSFDPRGVDRLKRLWSFCRPRLESR